MLAMLKLGASLSEVCNLNADTYVVRVDLPSGQKGVQPSLFCPGVLLFNPAAVDPVEHFYAVTHLGRHPAGLRSCVKAEGRV